MNRPTSSAVDGAWVPRLALLLQTAVWALSPFHFLIAYLVLLLIRPHEFLPGVQGLPLMPVVMMGAVAAWILAREKDFGAPAFVLLVGLVLAMVASRVALGWLGGIPAVISEFLPILLIFLLVATVVSTLSRQRVFLVLLFGASVYMSLHGIQQHLTGTGWTGAELLAGRIRYIGFFHDPNDLGLFLVMTLPMAFFLFGRSRSPAVRLPLVLGVAVVFYAIYLTGSRGTLLATLAVLGVYFARRYGWTVSALLAALVLPVLLLLLPSRFTDLDPGESSAHGRVEAWYNGMQMFQSNPLTGVGWGRFTEFNPLTAHNSLVLVLAETGLLGLTFWLAFFGGVVWLLFRVLGHWQQYGDAVADPAGREWADLARALLIAFVGIGVSAFFLSRSYNIILYLLAAVAVGAFLGYRRNRGLEAPGPGRVLERAALGALVLAAAFFVVIKGLLGAAS
ncbi:O-antigen ligase like membrane protein [Thiohalospira halophila DSM 15071]|uniref:O-antigen ligase like membrane protein n=1 Tax=Thiohalospira halophila DSM 15071 TaxID=1123397 RepID=A0A1I1NKW7_9GAMM|nr:O-antigen ligase family protein [Thiohalospira halophila]SFC98177.1 O-antigen ligase like membrane protein [Thiohalospira halophila DSM 15071]